MKIKITRQTTWTIEIIPVQKRKRSTGEQELKQQNVIQNAIRIITHSK